LLVWTQGWLADDKLPRA